MGRKRKTPVVVAKKELSPGDAMVMVREDMVRLQEAVTEKLAFIDGLRQVNKSPVTLSIPEAKARELRIPGVLTPTLLPLPMLVKVSKALGVDMKGVRKEAWKFLYGIDF